MRLSLLKSDCYRTIPEFYKNVARRMKYTDTSGLYFDPRKISVTEDVQNVIFSYYIKELDYSAVQLGSLWADSGPKADLEMRYLVHDGEDEPISYEVDVEEGFITPSEKTIPLRVAKDKPSEDDEMTGPVKDFIFYRGDSGWNFDGSGKCALVRITFSALYHITNMTFDCTIALGDKYSLSELFNEYILHEKFDDVIITSIEVINITDNLDEMLKQTEEY